MYRVSTLPRARCVSPFTCVQRLNSERSLTTCFDSSRRWFTKKSYVTINKLRMGFKEVAQTVV